MPTSTNITNLKINELTEAQYDTAVQQGIIGNNELSIITDVVDGTVTVMPTPSAAYIDAIVQFAGVTDANYTNGYFYKCVSNGEEPATYSWEQVDVQPQASGLPDQTGQSGKFLTTDGTTASWKDISTSPSTMPQLLAANWSSNTQTVNVTGVTANNVVMVSPSPVSATEYAQCGILCTGQAAGTLTFTCTSVPTNDLTVNVVCF